MAKTTQTVEQILQQTTLTFAGDILMLWFTLQVVIILAVLAGAVWMCLKSSFFSHGSLTKEYEHYH